MIPYPAGATHRWDLPVTIITTQIAGRPDQAATADRFMARGGSPCVYGYGTQTVASGVAPPNVHLPLGYWRVHIAAAPCSAESPDPARFSVDGVSRCITPRPVFAWTQA